MSVTTANVEVNNSTAKSVNRLVWNTRLSCSILVKTAHLSNPLVSGNEKTSERETVSTDGAAYFVVKC